MRTVSWIALSAALGLALLSPTAAAQLVAVGTPRTIAIAPGGPPASHLSVNSTHSSISVRWACPAGASGFEVFGGPPGGILAKLTATPLGARCVEHLATPSGTSITASQQFGPPATTYAAGFTHTGLGPATFFSFVVRTLYPTGGPADTEPIVGRTELFPAPNVRAYTGPSEVRLDWPRQATAYVEPSSWLVSRKLRGERTSRQIAVVPASLGATLTYTDASVPPGDHEYAVQAVDGVAGTPVSVVVGVPQLYGVGTSYMTMVTLSWSGMSPGGTARVLSSPHAGGSYVDITTDGQVSGTHWQGIAQLGSNLYYKVVVTYPGLTYESTPQQVPIPNRSIVVFDLKTTDQRGEVKLQWSCEPGAQEYRIMRRVSGTGPFTFLKWENGNFLSVFPTLLDGQTVLSCSWVDGGVPSGQIEYILVGMARHGLPVNVARGTVQVR